MGAAMVWRLTTFSVLVGHMPVRGETSEWAPVFEAIRGRHPHVPIFVFGELRVSLLCQGCEIDPELIYRGSYPCSRLHTV